MQRMDSTTIIAVRRDGVVAMAGDGQVTLGSVIIKKNAKKIRRIEEHGVLVGFAGAASDAFALIEKFEKKLSENSGNLKKSSVELAKEWREDKAMRFLDALLLVANKTEIYVISGSGDVMDVEDGIAAIGSGGDFAFAAGIALLKFTKMKADEIAKESMVVAGEMCIYTNLNIKLEIL